MQTFRSTHPTRCHYAFLTCCHELLIKMNNAKPAHTHVTRINTSSSRIILHINEIVPSSSNCVAFKFNEQKLFSITTVWQLDRKKKKCQCHKNWEMLYAIWHYCIDILGGENSWENMFGNYWLIVIVRIHIPDWAMTPGKTNTIISTNNDVVQSVTSSDIHHTMMETNSNNNSDNDIRMRISGAAEPVSTDSTDDKPNSDSHTIYKSQKSTEEKPRIEVGVVHCLFRETKYFWLLIWDQSFYCTVFVLAIGRRWTVGFTGHNEQSGGAHQCPCYPENETGLYTADDTAATRQKGYDERGSQFAENTESNEGLENNMDKCWTESLFRSVKWIW